MDTIPGARASHLRPTWVEVDLGALARNYRRLRDHVAPRRLWCVVKADAYGHGAIEVARRLRAEGADAFAVATVDEGVALREAGIEDDVLVMAGIEPLQAPQGAAAARAAVAHALDVAVWSREAAATLGDAAVRMGLPPPAVHLKVDTGMGRLGVLVDESPAAAVDLARACAGRQGVRLAGVFSNLAAADVAPDEPGYHHTGAQIERFARLCARLAEHGVLPPHRHLGNSAALVQHAGAWDAEWCTGVRPGLSLCGASLCAGELAAELEPVMSWHSVVAAVRTVPRGWPLGYGARRTAARGCTIAVVPVGYHDGFPRALSDRAEVLVGGRRARVVGAISMDLTLVDVTGISEARVGTPVVLLGASGAPAGDAIHVGEVAGWAGSIAHEVLCRVGGRVPRRYVDRRP